MFEGFVNFKFEEVDDPFCEGADDGGAVEPDRLNLTTTCFNIKLLQFAVGEGQAIRDEHHGFFEALVLDVAFFDGEGIGVDAGDGDVLEEFFVVVLFFFFLFSVAILLADVEASFVVGDYCL